MKLTINPDKAKAKSLLKMALTTLERLEETDIERYPSNTLKDYYDIIKELMESILYTEGVKMKGEGAHYETIEYICKKYKLNDSTRTFLQDMRDYRNRIAYEGFSIPPNYIKQNNTKIKQILKTLIELTKPKD